MCVCVSVPDGTMTQKWPQTLLILPISFWGSSAMEGGLGLKHGPGNIPRDTGVWRRSQMTRVKIASAAVSFVIVTCITPLLLVSSMWIVGADFTHCGHSLTRITNALCTHLNSDKHSQ